MTLIPVEYHGIHTAGPEQFTVCCSAGPSRTVFCRCGSPIAAAELAPGQRFHSPSSGVRGAAARRDQPEQRVSAINIISHFEGVFIASIVLSDGEEIDARPSDACCSRVPEMDIHVEEDVLNGRPSSSPTIFSEYFGLRFGDESRPRPRRGCAGGCRLRADDALWACQRPISVGR